MSLRRQTLTYKGFVADPILRTGDGQRFYECDAIHQDTGETVYVSATNLGQFFREFHSRVDVYLNKKKEGTTNDH